MSFMADQHKILLWKMALTCDNMRVRVIADINRPCINMLWSKYLTSSINIKVGKIKKKCGGTL